jgi:hypothetical protein
MGRITQAKLRTQGGRWRRQTLCSRKFHSGKGAKRAVRATSQHFRALLAAWRALAKKFRARYRMPMKQTLSRTERNRRAMNGLPMDAPRLVFHSFGASMEKHL